MGPRPDHRNRAQHKHTFAANAHTLFHVRMLSNFFCANAWHSESVQQGLNCVTGQALEEEKKMAQQYLLMLESVRCVPGYEGTLTI
jgi:hypothetical protein